MVVLEMVMLYWPMGSAIMPETAGPMMKPRDQAELMMDKPNAWESSSLTSDMIALTAVIDPGDERGKKKNGTAKKIVASGTQNTLISFHVYTLQ